MVLRSRGRGRVGRRRHPLKPPPRCRAWGASSFARARATARATTGNGSDGCQRIQRIAPGAFGTPNARRRSVLSFHSNSKTSTRTKGTHSDRPSRSSRTDQPISRSVGSVGIRLIRVRLLRFAVAVPRSSPNAARSRHAVRLTPRHTLRALATKFLR
jgi:hypothetical protein